MTAHSHDHEYTLVTSPRNNISKETHNAMSPVNADLTWPMEVISALGLTTTGLGAWVLKVTRSQSNLESRVQSLENYTERRLSNIEGGITAIQQILMNHRGKDS